MNRRKLHRVIRIQRWRKLDIRSFRDCLSEETLCQEVFQWSKAKPNEFYLFLSACSLCSLLLASKFYRDQSINESKIYLLLAFIVHLFIFQLLPICKSKKTKSTSSLNSLPASSFMTSASTGQVKELRPLAVIKISKSTKNEHKVGWRKAASKSKARQYGK